MLIPTNILLESFLSIENVLKSKETNRISTTIKINCLEIKVFFYYSKKEDVVTIDVFPNNNTSYRNSTILNSPIIYFLNKLESSKTLNLVESTDYKKPMSTDKWSKEKSDKIISDYNSKNISENMKITEREKAIIEKTRNKG